MSGEGGPLGTFTDLATAVRAGALRAVGEFAEIQCEGAMIDVFAGAALTATVRKRIEQIAVHGYTPEDDLMLPIGWLINETIMHANRAKIAVGTTAGDRDIAASREHLAATAALCWAAIDRLDAATARKEV
jgi:hypothetical protein